MSSGWTRWPAPAKLNLFLHIVGRRADGYHLLQTVFQLLDWGDEVYLNVRADGQVLRIGEIPGVAAQNDLVVRAARLLREHTGCAAGAEIRVDKRIPVGGGLGGGSSDAASALVGLNEIWQTGLSTAQLAALGLTLGADVPVFVHGHSAWAEGIGEQLTPIALPARNFVILDPQVGVPTAPLFQASELTRNAVPATMRGYLSGMQTNNVFAPVVRQRYPQVAAALDWLGQFGDARLSGSGGCVFVEADSIERAQAIAADCPGRFRAFVVGGVAQSALHEAVEVFRKKGIESTHREGLG